MGLWDTLRALAGEPWIAFIIFAALTFDFVNGFHDAANSIATIVGTRVLRPATAVVWAAWWNFAAAWFFGVAVANTVAKWVHPDFVTADVIFAGLAGAIVWDLLTWWVGLPTSSSHALLGGFGGAAMAYAGTFRDVLATGKVLATLEFILLAPLMGFVLGFGLVLFVVWTFRGVSAARMDRAFRVVQLGSAALYSLGHGTNDAQKTMGIILAVLIATKSLGAQADVPLWVVLSCHAAMGLGTLMGGWRIVKTMGQRICHLQPVHGFAAESGGALCLYGATWLGIPVSTTHTITGAIVGVGATRGRKAVRWGVAGRVVWAWVLTIPAAAIVSAGAWHVFALLGWH